LRSEKTIIQLTTPKSKDVEQSAEADRWRGGLAPPFYTEKA
jgi:hypothetical protein